MKMPQEKETEMALVEKVLEDDFGMQVENLARIVERGDNSEPFSAEYKDEKIIIKIIKDDFGLYPVELKALELLREHGIPVAKPLGYKENAKHLDRSILVQSAVPGMQMSRSSANKSPKLYKAIGQMLQKIHQIQLGGFGKLEIRDGTLRGKSNSWKESLLVYRPNRIAYNDTGYLQNNGFIDSKEAKKIQATFTRVLEIDLPKASFLHNDVQAGHIFTDGENITGLIDMGGVSAGDPRFDIAKTHYYFDPQFWPDFDDGYGKLTEDPLVDDYLLLNAARKVIYRHKNNFTDRLEPALQILKYCLDKR